MESQKLYRVKEGDLDKLIRILTVCFAEDPLYHALIPDKDTRERLMPELFTCDLTEFFETCEIYADSSCYTRDELWMALLKDAGEAHLAGKKFYYILPAVFRSRTAAFYRENIEH